MAENPNPQRQLGELFDLTKTYARQETVDPIKSLGKFIAFGIGAAVLGAASIGLLLLGVLRVLQSETDHHLEGHLTWVPYLGTLVVACVIAGAAAAGISGKKGTDR
ncbi:MAG: phage holin family protein [Actinobacteria bacterium]|nr:phage holin family protein [Actinomycetota bacterium]